MTIEIIPFDNEKHRSQVLDIWSSIFSYEEPRNDPALVINKKLAVDDGLFFVAVENGKVLWSIMAGSDGHRGWVYSLAVIPERRRARIGTRLLEHAENELRKLGCVKINLQIFERNIIVKEFYLKRGYDVEGRISMGKEISENIG